MEGTPVSSALRRSVVALAFLGAVSSTALATYTQTVFLDDGLSDTGNLYAATGIPVSPPYYQGRFSNARSGLRSSLAVLVVPRRHPCLEAPTSPGLAPP